MEIKAYTTDLSDNIAFNYSIDDPDEAKELVNQLLGENLAVEINPENTEVRRERSELSWTDWL